MSEGAVPAGLFDPVETVGKDKLDQLSNLTKKFQTFEKEIEELEIKLKQKKKDLEKVSRELIPSILNEVGLSELRLANGEKVVVEDKIKASIANKNYLLAYRNMVKAEGGEEQGKSKIDSLFKSEAVIEDYDERTLTLLLENNIEYDTKKSIHAMTLKKYCRGKLDMGLVIPEGISVFEYQETKIKK